MKQDKVEQLDEYFAQAGSWSLDREQAARRSLRLAWITAGMVTFVAVAEGIALVALAPLKTVVPYTLLVDRETGYVQALDPINGERITPTAALTRSFLVQYVLARESFVFDALQQNYRKAVLWSEGDVRTAYVSQMQASNPLSPLAAYPRRTVIDVQVKSVSLLGHDTALVRFQTLRQDPGAQPRVTGSWIATISFRYSSEPMTAQDRLSNPLGFRVTGYHKDVEILPETAPAVAPAAGATSLRTLTPSLGAAQQPAAPAPGAASSPGMPLLPSRARDGE